MFFRVHILYVEEGSAVYNWSHEERQKNIDFIIKTCEAYNFTYTIIPLETVFEISTDHDLKNLDGDDLKVIEEEKKKDEENHSVPENIGEI